MRHIPLPFIAITMDMMALITIYALMFERISFLYPLSLLIVFPIVYRHHNLYPRHHLMYAEPQRHMGNIFSAGINLFIIFVIAFYFFDLLGSPKDNLYLLIWWSLFIGFTICYRVLFSLVYRWVLQGSPKRVLIVGTSKKAREVAHFILTEKKRSLEFAGFLGPPMKEGSETDKKFHLGDESRLEHTLEKGDITYVLLVQEEKSSDYLFEEIERVRRFPVVLLIAAFRFDMGSVHYPKEEFAGYHFVPISSRNKALFHLLKRTIDIIGSLVLILLLSPILLLIALGVKLSSKGPVLYVSDRGGLAGKTFSMYKFRSMRLDEDRDNKMKNKYRAFIQGDLDKNVTKVFDETGVTFFGKFIRKSSLDELPQLFNVLKGEMSLIGPRPSTKFEVECYKKWQRQRLDTVPGITGYWQVMARSVASFDQMVVLDLYYIYNGSIWLDLEILLRTIPVVLLGKGSY